MRPMMVAGIAILSCSAGFWLANGVWVLMASQLAGIVFLVAAAIIERRCNA